MDIVRANITHLLNGRSLLQVGEESGVKQTWLQRYMNPDKPSGIQKANPEKMALLAKYFGVTTAELMYQDLTQTRPAGASHAAGREQEIVAAAVKLLSFVEDLAPEPPPREKYAERLYIALQIVREDGAEGVLDNSSIVNASRRLAARLRAVG